MTAFQIGDLVKYENKPETWGYGPPPEDWLGWKTGKISEFKKSENGVDCLRIEIDNGNGTVWMDCEFAKRKLIYSCACFMPPIPEPTFFDGPDFCIEQMSDGESGRGFFGSLLTVLVDRVKVFEKENRHLEFATVEVRKIEDKYCGDQTILFPRIHFKSK